MTTKVCTKCGVEKELGEFRKDKRRKHGLGSSCKECHSATSRAYQEANREKERARCRAYSETHREEQRAYSRAYYEAHREEKRVYGREYHAMLGNLANEKWQEISKKYATRSGRWSEQEDAYLASSTERYIDDALALQRTYNSVHRRLTHLRSQGVTLARDKQKETL